VPSTAPPPRLPTRTVDVDGVGTHHVDVGGGEAVVLLPGLLANHRWFAPTIAALAPGRRVLCPDLPGFGRSDKPDVSYSIPWYVAWLWRFLDEKGLQRAHLVGNSLGGQIALCAALDRPARVARLALVAPAGVSRWPAALLRLLEAAARGPIAAAALPRVPQSAVGLALRAIFPDGDLGARFTRSYARSLSSPDYPLFARAALRALHGSIAHPVAEAAAGLAPGALIVWGERDRVLGVAGARTLRRRAPDAELLIYRDSGHCPMLDAPARFNRELDRFLDGQAVGV
jgi:pimeloyl-ACP methyl ester carboxylesterase